MTLDRFSFGKPATLLALAALAVASGGAAAQQVYREVGAGGKVIFSDQPPAANAQPVAPQGAASTVDGSATVLPYELRQVAQRYPVTIYTRDECGPCDAGRSLLVTRGIPFDERQIKTVLDQGALQRLSGQDSLPLLSIGGQQLKGFSDAEWSQYLDAAGYPKSIQLPAGYRRPAPQPMVASAPASPTSPSSSAAQTAPNPSGQTAAPVPSRPPPAPRGPTARNPAGIQF
jgi:glutaredoxin